MTVTTAGLIDPALEEGLVEIDGSGFYAIHHVDRMAPFLMSVVSDGDRWMFVSSTGGLTAGRVDSSQALFPYETDDRLHRSPGAAGPVTAFRTSSGELWTPLRGRASAAVRRSVYKSVVGDSVVFEEDNVALGLTFRYRWAGCDRFGFVRTATLVNHGDHPVRLTLVDGLLGILPYGLEPAIYQSKSNLTHAYKRSEVLDPANRLAAYTLEAEIADRPEPAEVLRASIAWSAGLAEGVLTLSPDALDEFEIGGLPQPATLLTGRPGAYLLSGEAELAPGAERSWHIVADVARDQRQLTELNAYLRSEAETFSEIDRSLESAASSLVEMMAPADALQRTGDRVATAHQFSNVTYNVMRGGVPLAGYRLDVSDVIRFLEDRNREVARIHSPWIEALAPEIDRATLLDRMSETGDPQLMRLALEYLPFSFSRRHGDPSRPWNRFSIRVRDAAGDPVVYYEGNWRDIFQNWEALCMSFPEYLPGVISVFVGASTPDGFNPYRITRHGIDWEVPDPDDPWSNIGYWGDHQIVYLLRLLWAAQRYLPGRVEKMLGERRFSYAEVPYRIAPYEQLVHNPKQTIAYDEDAAARAAARVENVGGDGRLVWRDDGTVYLATLAEKLVVPALAKLSNFVPGGGIWMNTQRPEWNDANNALVGYGLSMVTLYHLRRYLDHLRTLVRRSGLDTVEMSSEVADWFAAVIGALEDSTVRGGESSDSERRALMDRLGGAFSDYRTRVYAEGFSGLESVAMTDVARLCDIAIDHLDATIRAARRSDGLYQAYNLIRFGPDGAGVEHLHEMLEGQVAVIESGVLTPGERADVVDALFASSMYRADQASFMLYPARRPPSFLEKNVVPAALIEGNPLLSRLMAAGDTTVIAVDADGRYRFHPDITSADELDRVLDQLGSSSPWTDLVAPNRSDVLETFEQVFRHREYTGRSSSMYGYEGIGSIYWHMVAKLLVAIQESVIEAQSEGASHEVVARLIDAYWRVRAGFGFNKTAREFGAIPIDPYSHSPADAGAQQPGMTGLVKEELLTRPLEMGVRVEDGEIGFDPVLLRRGELLSHPEPWRVYGLDLRPFDVAIPSDSLGVSVCQVPIVVSAASGEPEIEISYRDGSKRRVSGSRVNRDTSARVFSRTGDITAIHASVPVAPRHT